MERVLVSWSSGKDSALALHELLNDPGCQVAGLLTTVVEDGHRVSMHNIRQSLVEQQAAALGLPVEIVPFAPAAPEDVYEAQMRAVLRRYRDQGVTAVASGDLFLEDLRKYREERLAPTGLKPLFPLWKRDTRELARTLVRLGFRAVTTCVDTAALDRRFLGCVIDELFLADLPASVDPCGENGEYHSFVFDGPIFRRPVLFELGDITSYQDRYYYRDLNPL